MKNYSIVRMGNEYVVQAGETSVLKIASRRRAARLINEADELLDQQPAASVGGNPPVACDSHATSNVMPDSVEVP